MPTAKKRTNFIGSEEGNAIEQELRRMCEDASCNTAPSFSADSETYADNLIPFVDKHMKYLSEHKNVNATYYLANLKLMHRAR